MLFVFVGNNCICLLMTEFVFVDDVVVVIGLCLPGLEGGVSN